MGDEHQVVLRQGDGVGLAIPQHVDAGGQLAGLVAVELHVGHLNAIVELNAEALQVFHHGQDHRLILVIPGKAQSLKVGQTTDVVDIPLEIELHLQSAVPVFKGEHGPPIQPEVAFKDLVVKDVGDALVLQVLVGGEEQL